MRVGAVVSAPGMRLWIDAARLAAARGAVGDAFLRRLLAQPDLAGLPSLPRVASPAGVIPALQAAGAAVLLATLPSALRGVASAALPSPVPLVLNTSAAQAIVDRAVTLASESAR
jgi:hypothetical protein